MLVGVANIIISCLVVSIICCLIILHYYLGCYNGHKDVKDKSATCIPLLDITISFKYGFLLNIKVVEIKFVRNYINF